MIYNLSLLIKIWNTKKYENYYSILWSVLNIFDWNKNIKDAILSISNIYNKWDIWKVFISILWKDIFNEVLEILNKKKEINVNWVIFEINWIDFNFNIFDDKLEFKNYKNIELTFKSPTIIKKEINWIDINQLLPVPEIFLTSSIRKYNKLFNKNLDIEQIKEQIKNNVIVVSFDINTKIVNIKGNNKAGVIWKIKYEFLKWCDLEIKIILYNSLNLAKLVWIWTWNRLWLWEVGVYFNN